MLQLDMFNNIFGFTYNGNTRFKTYCGAGMSVSLGILSLLIISLFIFRFLDRTEPFIDVIYKKIIDPPEITINSNFAIYLKKNGEIVDFAPSFQIEAAKVTVTESKKTEYEQIPLFPCKRSNFEGLEADFDKFELSQALCLEPNQFQIQGGFVSDKFTRLQFDVRKYLESPVLEEEVNKNNLTVHLFFKDRSFDYVTTGFPVMAYLNHFEARLIYMNHHLYNLYFQEGTFRSYDGYLANGVNEYIATNLMEQRDEIIFREDTVDKSFLSFYVKTSTTFYEIKRSYVTFAATLASIVSMINTLGLSFRLVYFLFSKTEFYFDLLQDYSLMHRMGKDSIKQFKTVNTIQFKKANESKVSFVAENLTKSGKSLKFVKMRFNSRFSSIFCLSYFKFCSFCTKKHRDKKKYYDQSLKFFDQYIGFSNFFENMRALHFMKCFVLTEAQREIIEKSTKLVFIDEFNKSKTRKEKAETVLPTNCQSDLAILKEYASSFAEQENRNTFEENFLQYFNKHMC